MLRITWPAFPLRGLVLRRCLTASHGSLEKALPPRPKINEGEIVESFLKGSGPGGQKINKTSSAVQIRHLPTGIVVKSQETRSREQNRKYARQLLAEKLDVLEKGDQSRTAIKAERARVKKASRDKKSRRKYRKLAEEKEQRSQAAGETAQHEIILEAHADAEKGTNKSTCERKTP